VCSRTAGVMKTLMRNGRDRRSENPLWAIARKERVFLFGTDQRITSGPAATAAASHGGKPPSENRPDTWLHPNASQRSQIFPLHRGRRPYMAPSGGLWQCGEMPAMEGLSGRSADAAGTAAPDPEPPFIQQSSCKRRPDNSCPCNSVEPTPTDIPPLQNPAARANARVGLRAAISA
jgi:hypothetical protein